MRRAVDRDYVSRRRPRLRCCPGCGRPYRHLLPTAGMLALLLSSGLDLVLAKMALVTSLLVWLKIIFSNVYHLTPATVTMIVCC